MKTVHLHVSDKRAACGQSLSVKSATTHTKSAVTCMRCRSTLRWTGKTPTQAAVDARRRHSQKTDEYRRFYLSSH